MAPRIPTNTQVAPQAIPGARFQTAASPALLGAGADGQAAVGQGLEQAGNTLGQIVEREQENRNIARVTASEAALGAEALAYETELRSRRGLNADGVVRAGEDWWREASSRYTQELENDAQRRAFERMVLRKQQSSLNRLTAHQQSELEKARRESLQASIVNDINEAAASAGNDEAVAGALTNLERKGHALAMSEGWGAEERESYLTEQRTLAHKAVIEQLVVADPRRAREYYQTHRDEIAGGARASIEDTLKTAGDRVEAQRQADSIMREGIDERGALAKARKIKDPEVRDSVVTRIKARYAEKREALSNDQALAADEAWQYVVDQGPESVDDIPLELYKRLDGTVRRQIKDYLRADRTRDRAENDWEVLTAVEKMIEAGDITDPDQLNRYRPHVTESTFKGLRDAVIKRGDVPQTDVLHAFETRLGETRAKFMDNETDRANWLAFKQYILDRVKETRRPEDIDVWADRWFMEGYGTNNRVWRDDPNTFGEAVVAGREDFVIDAPDDVREPVAQSIQTLLDAGYDMQRGETAIDEFYTNYYLDAARYLQAHEYDPNPTYVAAYAYLRQAGQPITPANLNYVAEQLR